jgi:hypothetical protein
MSANPDRPAPSIDRLSPEELLSGFATSHLVRWFLVALLLHVLVIGSFSIGNIRDFVDPEGAAARAQARLAAAQPAAESAIQSAAQSAADPAAEPAPGAGAGNEAAQATPTAVEKATTAVAKPEDIPRLPDDLGLSIDDTNPQ